VIGYISANTQYSDYKPPTVDYFAERLIKTGEKYLGIPYKFGADYGQTANFDCSSFTKTVFAENGITLPRVSRDQATKGTEVSKEEMKPGDLVFFRSANTTDPTITHVAIYCSQGDILHTYGAGGVRHTGFTGTGWENRFITARRMF
jgi:cell wall-associated NlpC family hydrolase